MGNLAVQQHFSYHKNSNKCLDHNLSLRGGGCLLEAIVFGDDKKVQEVLFLVNMLQEKTSDVIAMPVTHIVSSPGEPTIISSVFIDLHEYLMNVGQKIPWTKDHRLVFTR